MADRVSPSDYRALVSDIAGIYERARGASARAVSAILVAAYWQIGKRIVEVEQKGKLRADYGSKLLKRLSRDLTQGCGQGFSKTNLEYMRRFYLAYRKTQTSGQLRWSHYQVLSTINGEGERRKYERQTILNDWGVRELREVLARDGVERLFIPDDRDHSGSKGGRLRARRGRLYTYRVLEAGAGGVKLDLGFNVRRSVPVKGRVLVGEGELVGSLKGARGNYSFKPSDAASGDQYSYCAVVEKVVDGDTLWVVVDLGFNVEARHKLRLRGINTPELDTKKGVKAKAFVEEALADCDFIIIRSFGTDKYARYLADIYYLPGEESKEKVVEEGRLLNQELLDAQLATRA